MPKTARKVTKRRAPHAAADEAAQRPAKKQRAAPPKAAARKKSAAKKSAAKRPRKPRKQPARTGLAELTFAVLDDMKAHDVKALDVRHLTSVTDMMVVAAGRSDRHVRSIADALLERCKAAGFAPLGIEGLDSGEWVLVDLGDVVVHVMLPRVREFYNIESLWDLSAHSAERPA